MPTSEKAQKAYEKLKNDASLFTPTLKKFVSQYTGLTVDTVIIYILFFALGIPNVVSYKYSTTRDVLDIGSMSQTSQGSIGSGVYGSGVFPFSLFLFIIANIMFFKELICYFWYPSVSELERRVEHIVISKRMGSMKQMSSIHKEDMMSIGMDAASLNPVE